MSESGSIGLLATVNERPSAIIVASPPPISSVISQLQKAKQFANRRPEYVKGLIAYLKRFAAGRDDKPIHLFDVGVVEAWFASRSEALTTQSSNIGRLSSLFSFAMRRRYISLNPCTQLESITIERGTPQVFTPAQMKICLEFCIRERPRFLLWFVLAGIVGLRPDKHGELNKINAAHIRKHLAEKFIVIDSSVSKVRNQRIIHLTDHAHEWITFALALPETAMPLPYIYVRRSRAQLKKLLHWKRWPTDILRHTALSYVFAFHGDEARVVREAGNSVKIFRDHYRALVTPATSAEFQRLLPPRGAIQTELPFYEKPSLPGSRGPHCSHSHPR